MCTNKTAGFNLNMRLLVICCLVFASWAVQAADNAVVLNIEPTRENPRNSEGAFVTLKSGRILFIYTSFYGGAGDESPARIVSIQSDDSGRTWSREPRVVVENEAGANVMSVSVLRLQSGPIALFYLVKNSLLDCRAVLRLSTDEAEHWSAPQAVGAAPGYFVLNNDRVIQLKDGRLVVSLGFHRARASDPKNYRSLDIRGIALWYWSDDEGKNWREAETWWALPAPTTTGLQEPGVVELADSRLFSWMRTDQGAQYGCYSIDGGKSWPLPAATALASPVSPASIKRLPGSADLLAIYNDHSGRFQFPAGKRTPLVAAISSDNGKTWPHRKLLETAPDGWFCYTAIHFTDDAALLAYCAGDSKVGHLNRLRIRRVGLDWLKSEAP
jgi:sialidase-1